MKRPKPDANNCADCWEEDCLGCELTGNAAHFYANDIDVEAEETKSEKGEV